MTEQVSPKLYRELDFKGRMARAALMAFTLYHLVAVLIGGGTDKIKRPFQYFVGFYDQGLKMTNSWGMFGRPPGATHVIVEGVMPDGTTVLLSTTEATKRDFTGRIRDVRIRKIQGKLTDIGDRARLGTQFLDHFCRESKERGAEFRLVRATNHVHELRDDAGKVTRKPSTKILLTRTCGAPDIPVRIPSPRVRLPVPSGEGDEGGL